MWTLIIGFVVLCLVLGAISALADMVGGMGPLIFIVVVFGGAYFTFGWIGILYVIGLVIGLGLIINFCSSVKDTVHKHDQAKKETAQINRSTQANKHMHENEMALQKELDTNCRWLGYMDDQKWRSKLPNYASKQYSTSFEEITRKFAKQSELQNIRQNDDWFQPFMQYILDHPQGVTVTKMLNEVTCPQFHITHSFRNGDLVHTKMMKGTERVSGDVPPLFNKTTIANLNENLYTPTKYAMKLYGRDGGGNEESHQEEISFDDL